MSVNAAANYPQYADTSIRYIPELFAPATLVKYYANSVVAAITNTKYEGQIKTMGDKVNIRTRPNITIRSYLKGQTLTSEAPESAPVVLSIDQGLYYDFVIDDVDDKQADIVLSSEFTEDAANQMRIAIDTDVLGSVYADASAYNAGLTAGKISAAYNMGVSGTPLAVTKNNVVEVITAVNAVLDEQNVPDNDRWGVLPAWFRYLIMNSDLKNASITGDAKSIIRNGQIGEIDGTMLYKSNLLSVVTDGSVKATHMLFGQKDSVAFAAQLVKNENLRAPQKFGVEYRGLHVYGRKVVKPEGLVHLYCYKG